MKNPALSNYKVGLVLSRAGLNDAQLIEVKQRLKAIAHLTHADKDNPVEVTIPSIHNEGRAGASAVEALVAPYFRDLYSINATIVENVCAIHDCLLLFAKHDEIWCCPSGLQTAATQSRAFNIHRQAQLRLPAVDACKYKIIPPWVEPHVVAPRDLKPKAMKGY